MRSMAVFGEISHVQAECCRACTRAIMLHALNCPNSLASVYSRVPICPIAHIFSYMH